MVFNHATHYEEETQESVLYSQVSRQNYCSLLLIQCLTDSFIRKIYGHGTLWD